VWWACLSSPAGPTGLAPPPPETVLPGECGGRVYPAQRDLQAWLRPPPETVLPGECGGRVYLAQWNLQAWLHPHQKQSCQVSVVGVSVYVYPAQWNLQAWLRPHQKLSVPGDSIVQTNCYFFRLPSDELRVYSKYSKL